MENYILFLRAVNVGGTGKLPMMTLKAMAEELGYFNVKTYIASGNLLLASAENPLQIKARIEAKLYEFFQNPCEIFIYNLEVIQEILAQNPFKDEAGNRVIFNFLGDVPKDILLGIKNHKDEIISKGDKAIYIFYGDGMADSKLSFPWQKMATGRNRNTIEKIAQLLQQM